MADTQNPMHIWQQRTTETAPDTVPAVSLLSKKEIFYILRPDCQQYRASIVRDFFTVDRMERCQIDPEKYPTIRQFTFDQSRAIRQELRNLQA